MRSKRSSSRLNLSSHAKVRSTRIRNAWIAALQKRFRPRFVRLRFRGFSGILGIKPALKMLGVEPVGNYAIRIQWSDGHSSGIYSYDHLRRICECAECRARWGE